MNKINERLTRYGTAEIIWSDLAFLLTSSILKTFNDGHKASWLEHFSPPA